MEERIQEDLYKEMSRFITKDAVGTGQRTQLVRLKKKKQKKNYIL
jgi:hypothetical protein